MIKGMDNLRIDMGDSIKKSLQQFDAIGSATIKKKARYKQDVLDALQGIEKNTANLNEIASSGGKAPPSQGYRLPPAFCRILANVIK